MTTYTNINKPSGTSYTNKNSVGKEQYDQADVIYDSATTFYDGTNFSQYTNITKPTSTYTTTTLIGSCSETNFLGATYILDSIDDALYAGQSFLNTTECTIDSCKFYLKTSGTPATNIRAYLFAHTGTFGSTGTPTGTALASSVLVPGSSLPLSYGLVSFTFSGSQRVTLSANTPYFIVIKNEDDDGTEVSVAKSDSSVVPGNATDTADGIVWVPRSDTDVIFYVYGVLTNSLYTKIAKPN